MATRQTHQIAAVHLARSVGRQTEITCDNLPFLNCLHTVVTAIVTSEHCFTSVSKALIESSRTTTQRDKQGLRSARVSRSRQGRIGNLCLVSDGWETQCSGPDPITASETHRSAGVPCLDDFQSKVFVMLSIQQTDTGDPETLKVATAETSSKCSQHNLNVDNQGENEWLHLKV